MENVLKLNRKGHIPTIMLVPIAVVLALTAWITFLNFDSNMLEVEGGIVSLTRDSEVGRMYVEGVFLDSVEKAIMKIESQDEIDFEEEFRTNFEEIVKNRDLKISTGGNFFEKVENKDYVIPSKEISRVDENGDTILETRYTLNIEDITVVAIFENSEVRQTFSVSTSFTEEGIIASSQDL